MTIICSSSIALILKDNDARGGNPVVLLSANYFVAALISLGYLTVMSGAQTSSATLIFGLTLGFMFVIVFFAFARAVAIAGASLATVSSRLSVGVPLLLAIFIYQELPSIYQVTGFIFTILTIILFYYSLRNEKTKAITVRGYLYLLGLFLGIGINDFCMKVFQEWRPPAEKPFFLFCIFGSAFIYTAIFIMINKPPVRSRVIVRGLILGVPNVYSSYFLLAALAQLAAIIVYPVINIGIILLTTLLALLIWREKLNIIGQMALFSGIAAIILLGL